MSTDPLIPQNDENKEHDVSIRHTTRLYRPSFLKDPKTLFDTYGTTILPAFSALSTDDKKHVYTLSRQYPTASSKKDVEDTPEVNFSDGDDISHDQQLTWLLPAVSRLELMNKKWSSAKQKGGYSLLLWQVMKDVGICTIVACLSPLISLLLVPFLLHHLSGGDYAVLAILNTAVVLLSFGLIVMRQYLFK